MTKKTMHDQLATIADYFNRSTRALDEADSAFAPGEGLFTAAQQVAHVAHTIEWFLQGAFAPGGFDLDFERMDKELRALTSLAAARAWMERACSAANAAVDAHTEAEWAEPLPPGPIMGGEPRYAILGALADHTAHHRGALTVYARLRGKTPPMPYGDM
jgi:uncharacterized damage-inducible protein DinB